MLSNDSSMARFFLNISINSFYNEKVFLQSKSIKALSQKYVRNWYKILRIIIFLNQCNEYLITHWVKFNTSSSIIIPFTSITPVFVPIDDPFSCLVNCTNDVNGTLFKTSFKSYIPSFSIIWFHKHSLLSSTIHFASSFDGGSTPFVIQWKT